MAYVPVNNAKPFGSDLLMEDVLLVWRAQQMFVYH